MRSLRLRELRVDKRLRMHMRLTGSLRQAHRYQGPHRRRHSGWMLPAVLVLLFAVAGVGGCSRPLPEQNTTAALLYAKRCGQCHSAYGPGSLSAAMWEVQVQVMETKMRQYGVPALTDQERATILSYLTRNAERP